MKAGVVAIQSSSCMAVDIAIAVPRALLGKDDAPVREACPSGRIDVSRGRP
jgi:hypothetical protein